MCGGGTQTTTTKTEIPPEVLARYNAVNARAEEAAQTPFQPYTGEFVAPLTPTQQAGIGATNQYSQTAQPYFGAGAGLTMQGARSVGPLTQGQIGYYQNPYTQYVAGATEAALRQQQGQQLSQQQTEAIKGGAFGGDRAGIQRAILQGQQGLATAQALAPIYSQGYQQAVQTAQGQQGVIGQDLARQLQAGQQIAGLGTGAQAAALQGAQAQIQAGTLQQQTQQAQDTAQYQQFLQQRGYPFQVAQFLANIAMGTGALSGNTQTSTSPAPFFSDKRLKHDAERIGEMHDGTPIYRFKYNGSDHTQIGLMAQDVEKRHPEAVGQSHGYKTVDYEKATDKAAHKAHGGGIMPDSMGGAVVNPGHYAIGGLADSDLSAILAQQKQSFGPFGQGGLYGGSQHANPYSTQSGGQSGYVPAGNLHVPKMLQASSAPAPKQTSTASELYSNLKSLDSIASDVTGKGLFPRAREAVGMGDQPKQTQATNQNQTAPTQAPVQKTSTDPENPTGLARGGLVPRVHYLGGGPVIPGSDENQDNPGSESGAQGDVLSKVVKEGAAQAPKSLPQPGQSAPSSPQGPNPLGLAASGISAAKGLGSIGTGVSNLAGGLGAGAEAAGAGAAAAGAAEAGATAAGAAGAAGGIGSALGSIGTGIAQVLPFLAMLSDERMKHNKRVVGKLYDGQPVYSFDYGDGRTQIGLMAQNVEHKHPEAVAETEGGLKMVDYHRATEHAAHKGHFEHGGLVPRSGFEPGGTADKNTTDTGDTAMPVDTSGSRAKDYYDYLTAKKGVEPHVAAGMLGNAFHESGGLQPSILGDQGNSYGLFQFNNRGEMPAFKQWAQENNRSVRDPYAQLDFTHERLTSGPYQGVYEKMRSAPSAGEAAGHFMTGYERPKAETAALGSRMSYADTISQGAFDKLKNAPAQQAITSQMQSQGAPQQGGFAGAVQDTGNFLSRNKDIILPVLQGLGAMASSPSRYLGSAILQGLGAGAKGYADLQKQTADIAQTQAETQGTLTANLQKAFQNIPNVGPVYWVYDPATNKTIPMNAADALARIRRGENLQPINAPNVREGMAQSPLDRSGQPMKIEDVGATGQGVAGQGTKTGSTIAQPAEKPSMLPTSINYSDRTKAAAQNDVAGQTSDFEGDKLHAREYVNTVQKLATTARSGVTPTNTLGEQLVKVNQAGLLSAPGYGFQTRADILSFLNTFANASKAVDAEGRQISFGPGDSARDIAEKVGTLQAGARASLGNQNSYAALDAFKNATPNLSQHPEAAAELLAQLKVDQQLARDMEKHALKYRDDATGGGMRQHAIEFEKDNPQSDYVNHREQIKQMLLAANNPANKGKPSAFHLLASGKIPIDQAQKELKQLGYDPRLVKYFYDQEH